MNKKILDIIACPICKSKLTYDQKNQRLICKIDKLTFPVKNGIPMMSKNRAKKIPRG
jgi:uncharacterized protein YbaR (Trm112 family)